MSSGRVSKTVRISNTQGLHARAADLFVKMATRFNARIELVKDNVRVDGKSILEILTLAATQGTELEIEADGSDAEQALAALVKLVEQKFAEDGVPEEH